MPYAGSGEISLYYEETGRGTPVLFVHEFAHDFRGWEMQVRYLSRFYRCITFNARGYPPSDVPERDDLYGQDLAVQDIGAVLDHLKLDRACIVGFSMGAGTALHFTMRHPERVLALVFVGGGTGGNPDSRDSFIAAARRNAQIFLDEGMGSATVQRMLSCDPTRIQLLHKDPRGFEEFRRQLAEHSAAGSALTMRNCQALRPPLSNFEAQLKATRVPTLIVAGDEDDPVIETSLFLKRTMPAAGLLVMPKTGHAVNLEEPAAFNASVHDFLVAVEQRLWREREAENGEPDKLDTQEQK
ncbi:pimeloyl-ACP methyl ester carboxylesterase [Trinickia symbiotica]|uniref:Alpha/beta hydrolase n=1 Tax=Trinickia symbiotica TaxID=863227 RepID=A0A2N7WKY6_9BURK|nr:alpha/beta hydrolase [Trinickia symbiotica]PMS30109.1 alpha/beta hydrolase [Trinickia symbiotica]PPK41105.1 pimeloyl-ACP methyl ester carboxylesterase [Trinickia symbiotica]